MLVKIFLYLEQKQIEQNTIEEDLIKSQFQFFSKYIMNKEVSVILFNNKAVCSRLKEWKC